MRTYKLRDGSVIQSDGITSFVKIGDTTIQLDGAVTRAINDAHLDADGGVFFQRELEKIKAKSYDVVYAELPARMLFPVNNEAGPGIETITYRTYDSVGSAKIINAYADDLPRADVSGIEQSIQVRSIGISYGYNFDEIAASQLVGRSLDQRRANASSRAVEETINKVALFGDAETGMGGLFDNPNIPIGAAVNPGGGTEFVNKTPAQILFDINEAFMDIYETSLMKERGNTLLLPVSQWGYIMTTPRSDASDMTIAQYVVANSPFLNSLDDIIALNECAAVNNPQLSTDAMVAYDRNPDKLELEIPVELQYLAVQQKNLEFIVPGRARIAGLNIYYPISLNIVTGI